MELEKVVKNRVSVRDYLPKPIEHDLIMRILKTAMLAPSAGNLHAYHIYVVTDIKIKRELAEACFGQYFVAKAPVVFIVCADLERSGRRYGERGEKLYSIQDATILAAYIQLIAVDNGLDTCWVGAFSEKRLREILKIPLKQMPIAMLPLGYCNRIKKNIKDTIKIDREFENLISFKN